MESHKLTSNQNESQPYHYGISLGGCPPLLITQSFTNTLCLAIFGNSLLYTQCPELIMSVSKLSQSFVIMISQMVSPPLI